MRSADIDVLETQIRREASADTGLGEEVELAIFVRDAGGVVAGISGWTWGATAANSPVSENSACRIES